MQPYDLPVPPAPPPYGRPAPPRNATEVDRRDGGQRGAVRAGRTGRFAVRLVSLMFFDDPSAPGAYAALVGMLLFAASCGGDARGAAGVLAVGRRAEDAGRRLLLCSTGYLVPVCFGVIQFGVLMH